MYVHELIGEAGTYEKITPGNTATGLALAIRRPTTGKFKGLEARAILVTVEDQTVTVAFHGVAPTAAAGTNLGHKLAANDSLIVRGVESVKSFKVIDTVSGSAGTIKVTCFF